MSLSNRMNERKANASIRENVKKQLFKTERDARAAKAIDAWSKVAVIGAGLHEMPFKEAANCALNLQSQATYMARLSEAQLSQSFSDFAPQNMLRLVRLSMPGVCRNKVFTEFAMESAKDSIKYIKPVYTKNQSGNNTMGNKHSEGGEDPWGTQTDRDATKYRTNDVYDGLYETFEDRMTQELINIAPADPEATVADKAQIVYKIDKTGYTGGNYLDTVKMIPGYATLFLKDEKDPFAVEVKRGTFPGHFILEGATNAFMDVAYNDTKDAIVITFKDPHTYPIDPTTITAEDPVGKPYTSFDEAVKGLGFADAEGKPAIKGFARFDLEDDFNGDELGEIELVMSDYEFKPRPTTIGVTWSQLAEITLDASFGVSAQDMLVTYAAEAIRVNLDYRAFKFAYAQAKMNKKPVVVFDAGFNTSDGEHQGTKEGYIHNAQTFTTALDTVSDNMLNEMNRGGVSRMVCGPSAGSYLKLSVSGWDGKGRGENSGVHYEGTFEGIPTFKAPSAIIPSDEILCVYKNDKNEGDVAIAFGTLIPFVNTGVIQRKNFYKEAGIASYGDWACLNKNYLRLIKIINMKDQTSDLLDAQKSEAVAPAPEPLP